MAPTLGVPPQSPASVDRAVERESETKLTGESIARAERAAVASILSGDMPGDVRELVDAAPESWLDQRLGAIASAALGLKVDGRPANLVRIPSCIGKASAAPVIRTAAGPPQVIMEYNVLSSAEIGFL